MHPEIIPPDQFVPSYLPPGHDSFAEATKAPGAVLWTRVYAGVIVALNLLGMAYLAFFWSLWSGLSPPPPPGSSGPSGPMGFDAIFLAVGLVIAIFALAHAALSAYLVVCPRKPLTHTLGTVTLALSLFSSAGCLPVGIILLVYWLKPEVKAWFDAGKVASPYAA
ncbi:MAG TPA: hypothetical protein VFS00_06725 [Polyangiaceae bacterium]|nr:hypothetical protein [Polyangiaceae bacterium]